MVGRLKSDDAERKAEQRTLRSLLKRSNYSTSDLEALVGRDGARGRRIIELINDGMIMADGYPASKRQMVLAERAALSRWENEGGSIPPLGKAGNQMLMRSEDGEGR
ncbi:hypothetical protein [Rhizobium sp. FKY42]|uniref:hypothetical protein n=1 Tax=Rhizobium sp. FKY42 TaxID=2562310 RepID=UPI0010C0A2A3|nr:hypothetical protein [Rhizobium sp. FKY42]